MYVSICSETRETHYKPDRLWVRSPLGEMKYLIYSFLLSGNEVKRSVEINHAYDAPKIGRKMRKGGVLLVTECIASGSQVSSAYVVTCRIQHKAKKNKRNKFRQQLSVRKRDDCGSLGT